MAPDPRAGPSLSVVVVDDHADVRAVIGAILTAEGGFEVVGEASNGKEAIDVVARLVPDLVLLDLAMPEMDGLQALPEIRRVAPAAGVIVLSGFGTDRTVRAAMDGGADAFLAKGADLVGGLVATCRQVMGRRGRPDVTQTREL